MTTTFYRTWRDVPERTWRWPNFSPAEIACRGTGKLPVDETALDKLQALRDRLGKPLIVRSAYRSPEHNRAGAQVLVRFTEVESGRKDMRTEPEKALSLARLRSPACARRSRSPAPSCACCRPDFNPIEHALHEFKAILRKTAARTAIPCEMPSPLPSTRFFPTNAPKLSLPQATSYNRWTTL